jgi:hypothetical protein
VAKSDSPAIKQKTKELREELAHADMGDFDRVMRHLINVPKEKIDKETTPARKKRRLVL